MRCKLGRSMRLQMSRRAQLIPRFRNDDFDRGIVDGVTRVAEIVPKGEVLTPPQLAALQQAAEPGIPWWIIMPLTTPFVAVGSFMLGLGVKNGGGFEKLFGILFGGIALAASLIAPLTTPVLIGMGLVAMFVGHRKGEVWLGGGPSAYGLGASSKSWRGTQTTDSPWSSSSSRSSSWSSSSGSSSSSSSSSSRSSSFGGGSSGGGGASGKW